MIEMFDFSKREQILLGLLLILIISVVGISYYAFFRKPPEVAFKLEEEPAVPVTATVRPSKEIVVHVVGLLNIPVYILLKKEKGKRCHRNSRR